MHRTHTLYDLQHDSSTAPSSLLSTDYVEFWFKSIEHQQICHLSTHDLCRLIQLQVLTEFLLPESLHRLYKNLVIGATYDGQLLQTVALDIPINFWIENPEIHNSMKEFLVMMRTFRIAETFIWKNDVEKKDYLYALEFLNRITI